jgi:hypothetical protein
MPDYAPAPWTLQQYKNGSLRISAANVVGDLDLLAGLGNDAELERMVRLMAATPDLSLALRLIIEAPSHDLLDSYRADAEATICKATGEGWGMMRLARVVAHSVCGRVRHLRDVRPTFGPCSGQQRVNMPPANAPSRRVESRG